MGPFFMSSIRDGATVVLIMLLLQPALAMMAERNDMVAVHFCKTAAIKQKGETAVPATATREFPEATNYSTSSLPADGGRSWPTYVLIKTDPGSGVQRPLC